MRWLATLSAVAFVAACSGPPGESGTAITNVRIVADTIVAVGEVSPLGGVVAEPHVIDNVTDAGGAELYRVAAPARQVDSTGLRDIQEGLRGTVRIPGGTANALSRRDFPIPVMGKTGTTSDFRDALFVGSTYGSEGITVAVRIGFDDNRTLGAAETGGRSALPIFREIMLRLYRDRLVGPVPEFPWDIEQGIDGYLVDLTQAADSSGR